MRVHLGTTVYEGRVLDLRARRVDGAALAAAVRGDRRLPVVTPRDPPAVYEHAGHVHSGLGLRVRTALAAAARSAGAETPVDDEIAELRERLATLEPERPSRTTLAERVPDRELADLQESVGVHRGRIQARERLDADPDPARDDLRDAAATLAERRTDRTAAEQSRRRRRAELREYRDRLARRRRLEDRLANHERAARETLVDRHRDEFASAVASAPGPTPDDPFAADPVTAAVAVLRIAHTPAPVVLSVDRFSTPAAAADWLDAPVVRC